MKESLVEPFAMAMLFISIAAIYYAYIISPRDEAIYSIIECMGPDNSREAYTACVEKLHPSRASPVTN